MQRKRMVFLVRLWVEDRPLGVRIYGNLSEVTTETHLKIHNFTELKAQLRRLILRVKHG
ncbi:hypothetical protein [Deinococcus cellulosilyticus]|uniref:Uncharacterized protein n=1 Tax=Deinococcus cellulosilyticus (strain DSM 18568 / NBRC 106333 / KACC 11606 / 5516J-15) TaxID=1223518 RepID=A0A511N0U2_DEIC1|nr:hypothetical protein [Deinococcus cellulosilyticus]GEM46006.1 hypothetical protein DC3_16410 [Deinococcus cellulosilyticus NBRC 106333 = KACC 11606]